jgi:hypothetical protein
MKIMLLEGKKRKYRLLVVSGTTGVKYIATNAVYDRDFTSRYSRLCVIILHNNFLKEEEISKPRDKQRQSETYNLDTGRKSLPQIC